jgi:uncharacterized alpha-E superfamily protein
MMLSRTADNIYWMTRMAERAQDTVRILEAAYRMEQLPGAGAGWDPILTISGQIESFKAKYDALSSKNVLKFMIFDMDNPSSVYACMKAARENARSERYTLPEEMFESINTTWIEMQGLYFDGLERSGFREFFEWIKDRTELFRGLTVSMMVKDEAFQFARLGTFIERADSTARLLDVKYHILVPADSADKGLIDYYQWGELLRSVGAWQAYRSIYREDLIPSKIVEMLIFSPIFPRSMHNSYDEIITSLSALRPETTSLKIAAQEHAFLHTGTLTGILKDRSLHDFLTDFIGFTADLSNQIRTDFMG